MKADFSGYATKNDIKCTDGRTIRAGAFKHNDGLRVPLVWQHQHNSAENILGHAILENRQDGTYAYGFFNDTPAGQHAKKMVEHGDVTALSIFAKDLKEQGQNVTHGNIKELSLCIAGANSGATIENVAIQHGDSIDIDPEEAVMKNWSTLEHTQSFEIEAEDTLSHESVGDILKTLDPKQKDAVAWVIDNIMEEQGTVAHSDDDESEDDDSAEEEEEKPAPSEKDPKDKSSEESKEVQHKQEGSDMGRNVFEKAAEDAQSQTASTTVLSHDDMKIIMNDIQKLGSFKEAKLAHAEDFQNKYGVENIDFLFPDARNISNSPEIISRRMEWVDGVINGVKKIPFARIKSTAVDITADEARARGYVKGNLKKEEVVKLLKRVTTPTTIYKKQKLDRDDIIDIVDIDIVTWIRAEMRVMLDEEIARAILIGDGREVDDEDKIDEERIRPIAYDDEMYSEKVYVDPNMANLNVLVDLFTTTRNKYKGSGLPTMFTTENWLGKMLVARDDLGRRQYDSVAALATALRVKDVVPVEAMETVSDLVCIVVNLSDYSLGADKGGAIAWFDDFDIDYNQYKYLIETRLSGALTKPKSALTYWLRGTGEVTPSVPTQVGNTISIPEVTDVQYQVAGQPVTGTYTMTKDTRVRAIALNGKKFPHNLDTTWDYKFNQG